MKILSKPWSFRSHTALLVPLPLFVLAITVIWIADIQTAWAVPQLHFLLHYASAFFMLFFIIIPAASGFLASGEVSMLLLGSGVLIIAGGRLAMPEGIVHNPSADVALYNSTVLLCAICHFSGRILFPRVKVYSSRSIILLVAGYTSSVVATVLVTGAVLTNRIPLFFIDGSGATMLCVAVVGAADFLFLVTAFFVWEMNRHAPSFFRFWYGLGLMVLSGGFACSLLVTVMDSPLHWITRMVQMCGMVYIAIGIVWSVRRGNRCILFERNEEAWQGAIPKFSKLCFQQIFRYGSAIVATGAGLGLWYIIKIASGKAMSPFIIFYPFVMVTALMVGYGPGMVTTLLSVGVIDIFIISDTGPYDHVNRLALVLFSAMGLFVCLIAQLYRYNRNMVAALEQRNALRETIQEKEFLADLLDQSGQPFTLEYLDGRLGRFNRAFEQLSGFTPDELRTIDWNNFTSSKWREIQKQKISELHTTGGPVRFEKELIRKDGTCLPVELLMHLVYDSDGKPEYYYTFLTDLTEQKRINKVMADSRRAALNIMEDTIRVRDALEESERQLRHAQEHLKLENRETLLANRIMKIFMQETGNKMFSEILIVAREAIECDRGMVGFIPEPGLLLVYPDIQKIHGAGEEIMSGDGIRFPADTWKDTWAKALQEGRLYFVNEPVADPLGGAMFENLLSVPFIFHNQTIGLLNLANKPGGFTTMDCDLMEGIVHRTTPVLYAWIQRDLREKERRRALWEQTRVLKRFELLVRTAGELLHSREPRSIIKKLCIRVMKVLDCHTCFNFLIDKETGHFHLNVVSGITPDEAKRIEWLDIDSALCKCAREGKRIIWEQIQSLDDDTISVIRSYGLHAYVDHPLIGPDHTVIGTLSFGTRTRGAFDAEEIELMRAVSDQIAATVVRMRSEEELGKYQRGLEKLVDERTVQLRKSQELLLHSQKMEAMGQLVGGIAHDFNNMMQVVIGYADRTLRKLDLENPQRENLEHIEQAAKSAANLTHRLLAFSRKQLLQPAVFSLNDLIIRIKPMLRQTIGEDIHFSCILQPYLANIRADPTQLEQVIINMAVNARNAMPDGGTLVFQTENVTLTDVHPFGKDAVDPGPYVMLAISDTGCGMDTATLERIFEPFFTTRPFGSGSGLGLATAYGTIRQSTGTLRVYSELGKGTTFKIYLPRSEEMPCSEVSVHSKIVLEDKGKTILVVEDNAAAREFVMLELSDLGFHVLSASNGDEAYKVSRKNDGPIHLLLTDVILPGANGWEISKTLSMERPEIVTLYMSGYDSDHIIKQGKLVAGAHFIAKPFSPDQLTRGVREALASRVERTEKRRSRRRRIVHHMPNGTKKNLLHILVVDDDPGVAEIIAEVLREPGNDVRSAEDGATALKIAAELNPDIVLLDLKLPDINGYDLSHRIREMNNERSPFIIAASGSALDDDMNDGMFDEYITKPIDFSQLNSMISKWVLMGKVAADSE